MQKYQAGMVKLLKVNESRSMTEGFGDRSIHVTTPVQ